MRLVIAHSRLNTFGGGERVTLELMRRLSARHEVTLWAGGYRPSATYAELAAFPRRDLAPGQWLTAVPDADAVLAQTFGSNLLALRHPATLCYVHTLRSPYLGRSLRPGLLARRALDTWSLRRAGALAANSAYTARRVAARTGRAVEAVPCGVDDAFARLPLATGTYALYVGRIAPEKGIERLLRWSAGLPVDLVLAGAGDPAYVAAMRRLAGPRVRWLGPLEGADLLAAYAGARMLVFLPHREEFGLAVLEAMAAGKPVVATPDGGIPELVRDGASGCLVADRDAYAAAVRRLAADDVLCQRLSQAGRAAAAAYTWDTMAARIEALLTRLAETRRHTGRGGV
jgi:glycosyltransferase involved in cell wall biosynthesis